MPAKDDREHFKSYRLQTRIKHRILTDYLPAYFHILKGANDRVGYIDAFAGRGSYDEPGGKTEYGSPVRMLSLVAETDTFRNVVEAAFIEIDDDLIARLREEVEAFRESHPDVSAPLVLHGRFEDRVDEAIRHVGVNTPTFAFVDPCGVGGNSFHAIRRIMDGRSNEAFIFFNIDGTKRIAGLDRPSPVLTELLGSSAEAERLHAAFRDLADQPAEREALVLETYQRLVRDEMSVEFFLPFGVEAEGRRTISHYLIHLTKSKLGFRIMKDVMWARGRTAEGEGLLFGQKSEEVEVNLLFHPHDKSLRRRPQEELRRQILLDHIGEGTFRVSDMCNGLAERPNDYVSSRAYKDALLDLEREGRIEALRDGVVVPQAKRLRKGKPTLSDRLNIRRNTVFS
jgi:three-Cys-motif partner protein